MKPTKKDTNTTEQEEEFPGYLPYAPEDDIMNKGERIDANFSDENLTASTLKIADKNKSNKDDLGVVEGIEDKLTSSNEFDVTKEDLEALGPKDLSMDLGDDEQLKHRVTPVDFSAEDLDIPGSELDDASEAIGSEDEENNSYSLGDNN